MKVPPNCVEQLLKTALVVAAHPPERPKPHQIEYHMSSASIEELRRALEGCGLDWRKVRREARRTK